MRDKNASAKEDANGISPTLRSTKAISLGIAAPSSALTRFSLGRVLTTRWACGTMTPFVQKIAIDMVVLKPTLSAAAAVLSQRGARHDEAIAAGHRLHICDNDAARCRPHRTGRYSAADR